MSKISISLEKAIPIDQQPSRLLFSLHRTLGVPIQKVKASLSAAPKSYLYRAELFMNDHVDVDEKIRALLDVLEENGLNPYVLEISHDENWEDPINVDLCLISKEGLMNILNNSVGDFS